MSTIFNPVPYFTNVHFFCKKGLIYIDQTSSIDTPKLNRKNIEVPEWLIIFFLSNGSMSRTAPHCQSHDHVVADSRWKCIKAMVMLNHCPGEETIEGVIVERSID